MLKTATVAPLTYFFLMLPPPRCPRCALCLLMHRVNTWFVFKNYWPIHGCWFGLCLRLSNSVAPDGWGGGGDWAARWQAIDFYSHKATAWATATATVTVNGKLHKRRSLRCSSYENPIFQWLIMHSVKSGWAAVSGLVNHAHTHTLAHPHTHMLSWFGKFAWWPYAKIM